jgi:hypothetical protein
VRVATVSANDAERCETIGSVIASVTGGCSGTGPGVSSRKSSGMCRWSSAAEVWVSMCAMGRHS